MPSNNWNDFNDAGAQQSGFDLIPRGTVAPVRMTIKPGGYDDPGQGWSGGYATESVETGSVYLAAEFVVTAGPYAKRRMWTNVGLHSAKGAAWAQMGRSFVRAALNSARGVIPNDHTPQAVAARRIAGLAELDGLEFVARVDIEVDSKGQERNVVKLAVEPGHPDYSAHRAQVSTGATPASGGLSGASKASPVTSPMPGVSTASSTLRTASGTKPSWAQ